jgi:hypothetical protein
MPDHRFDGGAAAHLAFDLRAEAALLPGGVDFELVIGRSVVAAIAGVYVQALDFSDQLFDRWRSGRRRLPAVRSSRPTPN